MLEQSGQEPAHSSALRQLLDLGFPFTLGEQGRFVARGIPAVTLTTLPDSAAQADATPFDETAFEALRLAELGRASQNLIVPRRRPRAGPGHDELYLSRHADHPGLGDRARALDGAASLPDRHDRSLRRIAGAAASRLAPAARGLHPGRLYFWGYAGALVFVAALLGAFPSGEARPLPPDPSLYTPSPVVLGILGVFLFVGWLVARERLLPRRPARPEETLAGHTVALLGLGLIALLVIATNPFSLVYLLPSLYAWLWLPQATRRGSSPGQGSS